MLTKAKQIEAVAKFLDSDATIGMSLEEVATAIVEGYHKEIARGLKSPASPPRLGMLFKTPLDAKVRRYVWAGEGKVWIVSETDSYGWLGPAGDFFEWCEEHHPAKMKETGVIKPDGKPEKKRVEMTAEEVEEEWSNPDWQVGDVVSQNQRQHSFEIIATAPRSVLLRGADGRLTVDENSNLAAYYRREIKGLEGGW